MRTYHLRRAARCRIRRWCLLLGTVFVTLPFICGAQDAVPDRLVGRAERLESNGPYHRGGPIPVSSASTGLCLPIDSLELTPIAWTEPGGGGEFVIGDTDQDSLWELMTGCGSFRIYENDGYDNYSLVHVGTYFIPWDAGDADGDGLSDIIGQRSGYCQLWESPTPDTHPSELMWESPYLSNIHQQSRIVDLDQDGQREILLGSSGDVVLFECTGDNSFTYVWGSHATIHDLGQFAVGDFDQDGWTELVVGDTWGSVYVYECTGDDSYHQVTTLSTNVWMNYWITEAHDMDGNDRWEFVVGGSINGSWLGYKWTIFEAIENDVYAVVDSIKIVDGWFGSAWCSVGSIGGDETEALVVGYATGLSVYKAIDVGTYVPIAYHPLPSTSIVGPIYSHDLNCNGYDEIVWGGIAPGPPYNPTLILEDRLAYGNFALGIATNGTIIPQGGTLSYDGMVVNLEATPETVDVWTEVLLPGGEPYSGNPVLGPVRVTLAPNDTLVAHPSHQIPMAAPVGEYTYMGFVSSSYPLPILAADTLFFTVVEP